MVSYHRTRRRRSALAYGEHSTAAAENNPNRLVHHERGRYSRGISTGSGKPARKRPGLIHDDLDARPTGEPVVYAVRRDESLWNATPRSSPAAQDGLSVDVACSSEKAHLSYASTRTSARGANPQPTPRIATGLTPITGANGIAHSDKWATPLAPLGRGFSAHCVELERCPYLAEELCAHSAPVRELVISIPTPGCDHRQH